MRKFYSLDKHCERVFVVVTSFFFSEGKKTVKSLTRNRTHDPPITGQMLYPLSYWNSHGEQVT